MVRLISFLWRGQSVVTTGVEMGRLADYTHSKGDSFR
jgi:hypothetical protein